MPDEKIREMNPEVAFWALNGKKPDEYKKKGPDTHNKRCIRLLLIRLKFPTS